jgi:hypothetical protein
MCETFFDTVPEVLCITHRMAGFLIRHAIRRIERNILLEWPASGEHPGICAVADYERSIAILIEQIDQFREPAVECWFPREGDRHMSGGERFLPAFLSNGIVQNSVVPCERFFLEFFYPIKDCPGWAFFLFSYFMLERAPAEKASLVTAEGGGHLDAAVTINPIELVLIAHLFACKGPLAPEAGLKGGRRSR